MDNETNVLVESEVSAFDAGWDDIGTQPTFDYTDEPKDPAEETAEAEAEGEAETPAENGGENQSAEKAEEPAPEAKEDSKPEEAESQFELNYMGKRETVGRNEVIALAQKGKDYDRIREKLSTAEAELGTLRGEKANFERYSQFLEKLAKQSNTDVQSIMDSVNAKILMEEENAKGNHISEDIALERIKLEREKAEFEAQKKSKPEQAAEEKEPAAEPEKDTAKAKRQDEFLAFAREYPAVKATDIPKEVWDDFNSGKSLVGAYAKYENKMLREQLAAAEQNNKNRERSTGSRDNAGAGKQKDAFDLGWDYE